MLGAQVATRNQAIVSVAALLAILGISIVIGLQATSAAPLPTQPPVDAGATAWMLASTALVLLMVPGLAMFYGGLVRTKNVLATLMRSFAAMAVDDVIWVVVGYALTFGPNVLGGLVGWDAGLVLRRASTAPSRARASRISCSPCSRASPPSTSAFAIHERGPRRPGLHRHGRPGGQVAVIEDSQTTDADPLAGQPTRAASVNAAVQGMQVAADSYAFSTPAATYIISFVALPPTGEAARALYPQVPTTITVDPAP